MREIVVLQIGHCGNSIGSKFWEEISDEHSIGQDGQLLGSSRLQLQRINVYYDEARGRRWVPRTICLDLDHESNDIVRSGPYGRLVSPDSIIAEGTGTGNNWAKGYYTNGADILTRAQEAIRRSVESCDCLQGFQLCHSLGGGTGSGLGCLIEGKLKEEYPDRILNTFTVYPSSEVSDVVVEPYNCILGMNQLVESAEEVICMDNGAMNKICKKVLQISYPSYKDLNHLVSVIMAGTTASFRFPGQLNTDLRKLLVNMVPFPRLHFFAPSTVPLTSRGTKEYRASTVQALVQAMFDPVNNMCHIDPRQGKFLTSAAIFRGRTSTREVEETMVKVQNRNSYMFSEWIPNNIKTAICDIPPRGVSLSASFLGNNTGIQEIFRKQVNVFRRMFQKKAFIHWFIEEGMEESEFISSELNITELISEYIQTQESRTNDDEGQAVDEEEQPTEEE